MKKAVCIGINNYPGTSNDLLGCVNDANDWSAVLNDYGFETSLLLDAQATRQNIKTALGNLVLSVKPGDVAVFTYSGHGTQALDLSGDEGDSYDEAIYVYDGMILDDELRVIIDRIDPLATLVVISDSCFSGSVTRLVPEKARPRFLPVNGYTENRVVRQRFLLPESGMQELLVSGCTDSEYSYDAEIDGRYNGAMSAMAIRVIRQNPGLTYSQFYSLLRGYLPSSQYPQSPQLEGSDAHKSTLLFEPFSSNPVPVPTPAPEPTPVPEPPSGCLPGLMMQVKRLFKNA
jgi:metacaspase-1